MSKLPEKLAHPAFSITPGDFPTAASTHMALEGLAGKLNEIIDYLASLETPK